MRPWTIRLECGDPDQDYFQIQGHPVLILALWFAGCAGAGFGIIALVMIVLAALS